VALGQGLEAALRLEAAAELDPELEMALALEMAPAPVLALRLAQVKIQSLVLGLEAALVLEAAQAQAQKTAKKARKARQARLSPAEQLVAKPQSNKRQQVGLDSPQSTAPPKLEPRSTSCNQGSRRESGSFQASR
jgi:hypothetical protein